MVKAFCPGSLPFESGFFLFSSRYERSVCIMSGFIPTSPAAGLEKPVVIDQ